MDDKDRELITGLRHQLHMDPELSMRETHTKERLENFIQTHTDLVVQDRGSWFYAVKDFGHRGLRIAFRADMDALPIEESAESMGGLPYASRNRGVSHKCGHDGHSAALCGFALQLDRLRMSGAGKVYLIFQPGEETGQGGRICSGLIDEERIDQVYAFHNMGGYPQGSLVVRDGLSQPASMGLTLHFQGKESHASYPEQGRNPAQVIAQLVMYAGQLAAQPHRDMVLCTVTGMRCGEGDFGISPGEGSLMLTLRAAREEEMSRMKEAVCRKAEDLSAREGLKVSMEASDVFPQTRNDDACLQLVCRAAKRQARPVIHMKEMWRASEDFGYYTGECPGAIFYLGNGEDYPALHTAAYDFNDANLEAAADLFMGILEEAAGSSLRKDEGRREHG